MSILGTALGLPEGSRLTGVDLTPFMNDLPRDGAIVLNVAPLPDWIDGDDMSGAVSPYLRWKAVGLNGNSPDGSTWFAALLYVPDDDVESMSEVATAGFVRSLVLLGVKVTEIQIDWVDSASLRAGLAEEVGGDFSDWSLAELLLALIVELSGTPLSELVGGVGSSDDDRREKLQGLLHEWAATYSGPE